MNPSSESASPHPTHTAQGEAPKVDLAYQIVRLQCPNGRHNTSYCYGTEAENEAARERHWQWDAKEIRPLIEASHAQSQARIASLEGALIRLRDCDWVITPHDRMDAVRDIARAALNGHPTNQDKP